MIFMSNCNVGHMEQLPQWSSSTAKKDITVFLLKNVTHLTVSYSANTYINVYMT